MIEPSFHLYVPTPEAVKVVPVPLQIAVVPVILTTGVALTVTNWLADAVQLEKLVIVTE